MNFTKMFGHVKDSIINNRIDILLPQFLIKSHHKAISLILNDVSSDSLKKDILLLGVHASGYLIPFRLTVNKEISFSEITQFYARFVEVPYQMSTLYIMADSNEVIEGVSSGK